MPADTRTLKRFKIFPEGRRTVKQVATKKAARRAFFKLARAVWQM
jgi:hypothetical protein